MGAGTSWYTLETAGDDRAEKFLSLAGYTAFQATHHKIFIHKRNKAKLRKQYKLLPGYIFVELESDVPWRLVMSTPGVVRVLSLDDTPVPMPPGIVEALIADCEAGVYDEGLAKMPPMEKGQKVVILSGPMARRKGTVHSSRPNSLQIVIDHVARMVTVPRDMVA